MGIQMSAFWEAVGLSPDLAVGVVMPATWQNVELAVWRSASGKVSAWKDRCPHRGMRLSHGFVRGETLSCIYHGWVYGTSGACSRIPAHPDLVPPAAIAAEALACREQDGVIFVAPDGVTAGLPDLTGLVPIRSMSMLAQPADIARALPGAALTSDGTLRWVTRVGVTSVDICLLLQTPGQADTKVHMLAGKDADKIAVSRWLESLRRQVEEQVAA